MRVAHPKDDLPRRQRSPVAELPVVVVSPRPHRAVGHQGQTVRASGGHRHHPAELAARTARVDHLHRGGPRHLRAITQLPGEVVTPSRHRAVDPQRQIMRIGKPAIPGPRPTSGHRHHIVQALHPSRSRGGSGKPGTALAAEGTTPGQRARIGLSRSRRDGRGQADQEQQREQQRQPRHRRETPDPDVPNAHLLPPPSGGPGDLRPGDLRPRPEGATVAPTGHLVHGVNR